MLLAFAVGLSLGCSQGGRWTRALEEAGVKDPRVIAAMKELRRADFLPPELRRSEYADRPLAIGHGQTTSQPSLIALMVQELRVGPEARVLEVGTGSGYQTALLATLVEQVFSIERIPQLAAAARTRIEGLGFTNVAIRAGDGTYGWRSYAPFDAILVTAGVGEIPRPLLDQVSPRGRMLIPIGDSSSQALHRLTKTTDGEFEDEVIGQVKFVPLRGQGSQGDR